MPDQNGSLEERIEILKRLKAAQQRENIPGEVFQGEMRPEDVRQSIRAVPYPNATPPPGAPEPGIGSRPSLLRSLSDEGIENLIEQIRDEQIRRSIEKKDAKPKQDKAPEPTIKIEIEPKPEPGLKKTGMDRVMDKIEKFEEELRKSGILKQRRTLW